jgi:hypothetical protein
MVKFELTTLTVVATVIGLNNPKINRLGHYVDGSLILMV